MVVKRKVEETGVSARNLKKRPEVTTDDEGDAGRVVSEKKGKIKDPVQPLDASIPHNKNFPESFNYRAKAENSMRIVAWNMCGWSSSHKKGAERYLASEDADIVVLSETKVNQPQVESWTQAFEHQYWAIGEKKGYAGVAVLSKIKPLNSVIGLPTLEDDNTSKARLVTLEFENSYLVACYVPNAGQGLKTMSAKISWNEAFERYLRDLDSTKPIIWCGDINAMTSPKDIRNDKTNWNKSAGWTETERDALLAQLNPPEDSGHGRILDVWRERNPETEGQYTYYSYRFQCREKGIGWRLDAFFLSERIFPNVGECHIRHDAWGASDHLPIVLDYKAAL